MEEELSFPPWLHIPIAAVLERVDMHVVQPDLPILHPAIRILKVSLASPDRFHFGPDERNPRIAGLVAVVLVSRPAVADNHSLGVRIGDCLRFLHATIIPNCALERIYDF